MTAVTLLVRALGSGLAQRDGRCSARSLWAQGRLLQMLGRLGFPPCHQEPLPPQQPSLTPCVAGQGSQSTKQTLLGLLKELDLELAPCCVPCILLSKWSPVQPGGATSQGVNAGVTREAAHRPLLVLIRSPEPGALVRTPQGAAPGGGPKLTAVKT